MKPAVRNGKEIILKAEKEKWTSLSLSNMGLTTLWEGLWRLTNLISLDLQQNNLSVLPSKIGNLLQLRTLNLNSNKFRSLPSEIQDLQKLEILRIGNYYEDWERMGTQRLGDNVYPELPISIEKLVNLRELDVVGVRLTDLSSDIGKLKKLEILNISRNLLTIIPPEIGSLKKLRILDLNDNFLRTLPPELGGVSSLESLYLYNNKIINLPNEIIKIPNLKELEIRNNPLPIPEEIITETRSPKKILDYLINTFQKGWALNESKCTLIGQGSVGKTSILNRIIYNVYEENEPKTHGIKILRWQVNALKKGKKSQQKENNQTKIQINCWDFGGQEIMHATHQFFLSKRSLYLLVLDSRLTQEENRVEYWLKIIQSFGGESPVLIVGNKIDQHPLDIDRTGLQKKYPNIVGILETSAATGAGIEELKAAITKHINKLPHIRDLLPANWFVVKTELENLGRGRRFNFISYDKYLDLCNENEVSDETSQRTLIGFLHDLGVVLHFQDDPRLEALGILNPQWVTNGVYKILNSHTLFQNKGVLTTSMLDEILNLPEYPRGKRLFIVDMMKKFELCYDIESDKTFLVPDLLPKDEPAELKFNGVPAFEYAYPVLPSSIITRFIVRMNQKIENHFVWRTGVVLKIGENLALVKADIEDRKITIAIDGVEHTRRDALSAIRYQLDEIHGSIKGLDAQKRVPIPEAPEAEPLDYDYLLQLERDGFEEHPVKDGNRLVKVNVRKLLSGVVSEAERRQNSGNITNIYIGGDVKDSNIIAGDENETSR